MDLSNVYLKAYEIKSINLKKKFKALQLSSLLMNTLLDE